MADMRIVELIYDQDCPNVPHARENLLRALAQTGESPHWREWERTDPRTPVYARAFGSPTVLIDGRDVADSPTADGACCRIYANSNGRNQGAPPVALIVAALTRATVPDADRRKASCAPPVLDNRSRSV